MHSTSKRLETSVWVCIKRLGGYCDGAVKHLALLRPHVFASNARLDDTYGTIKANEQ